MQLTRKTEGVRTNPIPTIYGIRSQNQGNCDRNRVLPFQIRNGDLRKQIVAAPQRKKIKVFSPSDLLWISSSPPKDLQNKAGTKAATEFRQKSNVSFAYLRKRGAL